MKLQHIFANNERWIQQKQAIDPDYFSKLVAGQSPEILYIGCSDSRVTAEDMMGAQPGDLFVHRNIANLVPNTDVNSMSVINYAVDYLKVKHIVVCGHYGCGGVDAAMKADDLGILNPWLKNIRDVFRLHQEELRSIRNYRKRYDRLVEINVQEQCINVLKSPEVQGGIRTGNVHVHGWVFDFSTGRIKDLELDLDQIMANLKSIYRIEEPSE